MNEEGMTVGADEMISALSVKISELTVELTAKNILIQKLQAAVEGLNDGATSRD